MINRNFEGKRGFKEVTLEADYVVVGGGLTGLCSAIAAAREGLTVVLVQDRPVLGGNASSEVRLWALGATSHMGNNNRWSREGGIIDEILVENTWRNKEGNPVLFDMVLIDKVLAEKNITLLLNTTMHEVLKKDDRTLSGIVAINPQNGTEYHVSGKLFADCTGDGTLAYLSGASYRMGAEDRDEYSELFAPDPVKYGELLGHSILFYIRDTGKPVRYTAPDFALKDAGDVITKLADPNYFCPGQQGCKYWWLEYGGRFDTVTDTEEIKYELWKVVYGVWDYIKNSGRYPEMETYTLEWAGLFPGKRESRRFKGLYTITQQDIIEQRHHYDAVAYGGWAIDLHPSDGVYAPGKACNQWHSKGVYQIPYRCYVTPDLDNLFIGGRIISTSHVANGSTRVMCTAALGGEVTGRAAALCASHGWRPADLASEDRIKMLQERLVRNGNFIPGLVTEPEGNLADDASMEVSSELVLESLPHDGSWFRLDYPAAELIPVSGKVPSITMTVEADEDTELLVELRSSIRKENYTPDRTDESCTVRLTRGVNEINLRFGTAYSSPRYVFVCFMANPHVKLPLSRRLVTGLMAVYNHINPAVSNFGRQTPPEGIGVEPFEFWCPKRRPEKGNIAMKFTPGIDAFGHANLRNSIYRPYIGTNAWVPQTGDSTPTLVLRWPAPQKIGAVSLFFDTDADHAMESVQMGHYDSVMPCCYREFRILGSDGRELAHIRENHSSMRTVRFGDAVSTDSITIQLIRPDGDVCPGLMGINISL